MLIKEVVSGEMLRILKGKNCRQKKTPALNKIKLHKKYEYGHLGCWFIKSAL